MKIVSSLLFGIIATTCCLGNFSLEATSKYERFEADPSQQDKPATIKVLLDQDAPSALLEVKGPHLVYNPATGAQIASGSIPKLDFIKHDAQGLHWGRTFPGVFQIRVVPKDAQTTVVVNGSQYRGCVEVHDINGKLTVINETDVESYLKSSLNCQITDEMDSETMEALAIVARTNTYYLIEKKPFVRWHTTAQEVGYQGYGTTLQNLAVDQAVDNTRHVIMTYHKAPFAAAWTQNCAGKTAPFSTIFRKEVTGPKGVEITLAGNDREKARWAFSIGKRELAKSFGLRSIASIDLFVDKGSGKVYGARLSDGENSKNVDFLTLQKKIGAQKLRSSDFSTTSKGDSIQFNGYGEGPGVGLCLYTSNLLAEKGEKAPKILTTFFPEAQIEKARNLPSGDIK